MKKGLQRILDFGAGLVPGSTIFQGIEVNDLEKREKEINNELNKLSPRFYPNNVKNVIFEGLVKYGSVAVCLLEGAGLAILCDAVHSFATGNSKKGVYDLIWYGAMKGLISNDFRNLIKGEQSLIKSKETRLDDEVAFYKKYYGLK
jgi:hypothetical protein